MRDRSRAVILQSALELFARESYQGTTMDRIAQRSRISKGLIYNYFASKEELLEAVIRQFSTIFEGLVEQLSAKSAYRKKLRTFIKLSFSPQFMDNDYLKLYTSLMMQPRLLEKFSRVLSEIMQQYVQLLSEVFKQAGYSQPHLEARVMLATLDGIALHYWVEGKPYPLEKVKKQLLKRYCPSQSDKTRRRIK